MFIKRKRCSSLRLIIYGKVNDSSEQAPHYVSNKQSNEHFIYRYAFIALCSHPSGSFVIILNNAQ
jgi:hypothetical protein